jgi:ABC-type Fe3+/spermidine/putrescine transport system ATPase subunit
MHIRRLDRRALDDGHAVALSLRGVSVRGGGRIILRDIDLSVPRGQRLALLGPPGAGKTALLLAVAGWLRTDRGTVLMDGRDVTRTRAAARGVGVALASSPRGLLAPYRRWRSAPRAAHGLLLLDQPQAWPDTGVTVVAAFSDHALALASAHRIAILRDGRIVQAGPTAAVYRQPRNAFVARFLCGANILAGAVREVRQGGFVMVAEGVRLRFVPGAGLPRPALGARLTLALPPDRIALLTGQETADNMLPGIVADATSRGARVLLGIETPLGRIDVLLRGDDAPPPSAGARVQLGWASDAAMPVAED